MTANEPTTGFPVADEEGAIDESEVFDILGNDRRREIVTSLARRSDGVALSDLASEIARREEGEEPTKNLYKSVYVSLQQTHLPKLEEEGVVRYDRDSNTVRPGPRLDDVTVYVTGDSSVRRAVHLAPPVVSLVGLAAVLGALAGVPLVAAVGHLTWAVAFLVLVALVSLYAAVDRR